jgi:autophagy-related protein 17
MASSRLNETLDVLRETPVDGAFRPQDEEPKYLFDFCDEGGVRQLYDSIKDSMDRFKSSRQSLLNTFASFDQDLGAIDDTLNPPDEEDTRGKSKYEDVDTPLPSLFASLENQASEIAKHLEGLVKHYDLCVSALKNTEGGGEAISKASQGDVDQNESKLAGFGLGITRFDDEALPQSLTDEDRASMLAIIAKDAQEVDDVVNEISDRLADMEEHLANIHDYMLGLRTTSSRLRSALKLLKQAASNIPVYIQACAEFQVAWAEEREVLDEKMKEIELSTDFYSGFAAGYDGLIVEVQRRKQAKREIEKVVKHAMAQIDKLCRGQSSASPTYNIHLIADPCTADFEQREEFMLDQGDYLPVDIWPGVKDPPIRYGITVNDEDTGALPNLKRDLIETALKRLSERNS